MLVGKNRGYGNTHKAFLSKIAVIHPLVPSNKGITELSNYEMPIYVSNLGL